LEKTALAGRVKQGVLDLGLVKDATRDQLVEAAG
jgi:hypothetical protein